MISDKEWRTSDEVDVLKLIIKNRKLVQAVIGFVVLTAVLYFNVGLGVILAIGSFAGIIFGKVFCRWMCPIGFLMELMFSKNKDDKQAQLYNYHKLGCPVAWVSGLLNRVSLFKVKRKKSQCTNCGICDKVCYITSLNPEFSLYKKEKKNPALEYSCSKCLSCVDSCPSKSLEYKV